ncbi:MAG: hypothetical protein ACI9XO_003870 [Paraglaciecola sp.]|jgi:hypothetical protein
MSITSFFYFKMVEGKFLNHGDFKNHHDLAPPLHYFKPTTVSYPLSHSPFSPNHRF